MAPPPSQPTATPVNLWKLPSPEQWKQKEG